MATRRSIVALLGLAPAAAISAESFAEPSRSGIPTVSSDVSNEKFARALRELADAVDRDEVMARCINVTSTLDANKGIMGHTLTFDFLYVA